MDLAPDWLSVVNLFLTAFLGWKTIGPRRKTKFEIWYSGNYTDPSGVDGYHALYVRNSGYFPANGLMLEPQTKGIRGSRFSIGNVPAWMIIDTGIRLRGIEAVDFFAIYLDADNKLTRQRVKIDPGGVRTPTDENEEVRAWIDIGSRDA